MSRFVVVSFAVLGWAFYELSDGADFEPPARPQVAEKTTTAKTLPKPPAQAVQTSSLNLPAKPVLKPREKVNQQAIKEERARLLELAKKEQEERQAQLDKEAEESRREVLNQGLAGNLGVLSGSLDTTTITFATLDDGGTQLITVPAQDIAAEDTTTRETQAPEPDFREVIGTRVNMRDGPGTIYPIVRRLNIGESVEVLDDPGGGWLRLRLVDNRQIGWIAASLISKKEN